MVNKEENDKGDSTSDTDTDTEEGTREEHNKDGEKHVQQKQKQDPFHRPFLRQRKAKQSATLHTEEQDGLQNEEELNEMFASMEDKIGELNKSFKEGQPPSAFQIFDKIASLIKVAKDKLGKSKKANMGKFDNRKKL